MSFKMTKTALVFSGKSPQQTGMGSFN